MHSISQDYFDFLLNIKVPYSGYIDRRWQVYCQPILAVKESPSTQAYDRQGFFLQTSYVPVISENPEIKYSDDEIASMILEKICNKDSDGTFDVFDVDSKKVLHFENNINTVIDVSSKEDRVSIRIGDTMGNRYSYEGNLSPYIEKINESKSNIPWGKIAFDAISIKFDEVNYRWNEAKYNKNPKIKALNGKSRSSKIKYIHDAKKKIRQKTGIKIKAQNRVLLDKTIPKICRKLGKSLSFISGGMIVYDIVSEKGIKASHVLDAAMLGVCFIPVYGWIIGGAYFLSDLVVMGVTYGSTGEAKSIGDFLDGWIEDTFEKEDGKFLEWDQLPTEFDGIRFSF